MEDTEPKKAGEMESRASEMASSSSTDWFGKKWLQNKKPPTASADSKKQPEPYSYDDPLLPPLKPLRPLPFDPLNRVYDMKGDKLMLIFSHTEYQETHYYSKYENGRPEPRKFTDRDVRRLDEVFSKELGFSIEVHPDKIYSDIRGSVKKLRKKDHSNTACVCIVILTHGDSNGELMAADQPYELEKLVTLLQQGNDWLVGKPKLFIVQACRGGEVDEGRFQLDYAGGYSFVSTHADTLVLRSSVEGYVSWKDEYGSWLIQELCRVVHATHRQLDFLQMTTMVTSLVVYEHESHTDNPADNCTKQTPEVWSTLTKLLRFNSTGPSTGAEA